MKLNITCLQANYVFKQYSTYLRALSSSLPLSCYSLFRSVRTLPPVSPLSFHSNSSENGEESLHEGDIRLTASQQLALDLHGDPTASLAGARGIMKDRMKLWSSLIVPYSISSELGTYTVLSRGGRCSMQYEWGETKRSCLRQNLINEPSTTTLYGYLAHSRYKNTHQLAYFQSKVQKAGNSSNPLVWRKTHKWGHRLWSMMKHQVLN